MSQEQKDSLTATISVLTLIVSAIWFITEPKFETLILVLSTIATVLTLYVSKKKIEKVEKRYITKPRELFKTSVSLWGPTGSGKSWLVRAFAKVLKSKYEREINGLKYSLEKLQNIEFEVLPPTTSTERYTFNFERSRTSESFSQAISSFRHEIGIFDNRGTDTLLPIEKGDLPNLLHADIVVLALDHTSLIPDSELNNFRNEVPPLIDDFSSKEDFREWMIRPEISKKHYAEAVRRLLRSLEKMRPDKKRFYVVCFMKCDGAKESQFLDSDGLIDHYFGEEMTEALNEVADKNRIRTFAISSAGYILGSNGNLVPNFREGRLMQPEKWNPYSVEFPFFWAFEELEKQALLDKFSQSFWGRVTAKSKLKKYIEYPKPNYDL